MKLSLLSCFSVCYIAAIYPKHKRIISTTRYTWLRYSSKTAAAAAATALPGRCHIKMSPPWKIRPGKNNRGFDNVSYLRCLHKKSFHCRIAPPPRKVSPTDNLPVKIRLARAAAGKLSVAGNFSGGEGDPIRDTEPHQFPGASPFLAAVHRLSRRLSVERRMPPVTQSHGDSVSPARRGKVLNADWDRASAGGQPFVTTRSHGNDAGDAMSGELPATRRHPSVCR